MRVREPRCDVVRDVLRLVVCECRVAGEQLLEHPAGEVLEHHVRPSLGLAVRVEVDDVRMRERRGGTRLALEARTLGVRTEELDDHLAPELDVGGEVDLAHRPAEILLDAVPVREQLLRHEYVMRRSCPSYSPWTSLSPRFLRESALCRGRNEQLADFFFILLEDDELIALALAGDGAADEQFLTESNSRPIRFGAVSTSWLKPMRQRSPLSDRG